jgi:transcriptional regulator with XRE-family HTH domain
MSIIECGGSTSGSGCEVAVRTEPPTADRPLQRLALVRRREGVSRRTVARRLKIDVAQVKSQEDEKADMLLSNLYQWQEVLEVPVTELLVESNDPLSAPVLKRAQMVRLMKTAQTILERSQQISIRRMAQTLIEQLLEAMPELEHVTPWHAVGQRRTRSELGQAAQRRLSLDWFQELGDA